MFKFLSYVYSIPTNVPKITFNISRIISSKYQIRKNEKLIITFSSIF